MESLLKSTLVFLTGIFFGVAFTPPNGDPKIAPRPPLDKGFTAQREWSFVWLIARILPLMRLSCYIATTNECLFILSSAYPSVLPLFYRTSSSQFITFPFLLGALLTICGGTLRILCYRALGAGFTFEMVQAGKRSKTVELAQNPKLVTHGPYSIVRHPSYVGSWMCWIGLSLVQLDQGSWIRESGFYDHSLFGKALVWVLEIIMAFGMVNLLVRVEPEDKMIHKQFGKEWEEWAKRVRWKMIPGIY
ncbi:hypothetical protein VNI00_007650 [Paramarasmius palmivorus]|uniref:Protein-S-isoprenylcysteine O-methyltransferase n=1 Tax=Paramarasmius palmivorus TaxID=297713 RepID=A0AAW0D3A1_9AGAR